MVDASVSPIDRLMLARRALAKVMHDLDAASLHPVIDVEPWNEGHVCIVVNHGFTAPSMWASTEPEATAEVAAYVQAEIADDAGCWPVCSKHDRGLAAIVDEDGVAAWRCSFGPHVVAPIGGLSRPCRG